MKLVPTGCTSGRRSGNRFEILATLNLGSAAATIMAATTTVVSTSFAADGEDGHGSKHGKSTCTKHLRVLSQKIED